MILPVRGEEIIGLNQAELLDLAALRLADILYYQGVEATDRYTETLTSRPEEPPPPDQPPPAQEGDKDIFLEPLGPLTQASHDRLRPFVLGLSLGAGALLAILVLLSRGFGRLGSPGVALLVALGPLAFAFQVMSGVFADMQGDEGDVFPQAAQALHPTIDDLARIFTILAAVGGALILAAVLGNLGLALWQRLRTRPSAGAEEPAEGEEAAQGEEAPAEEAQGFTVIAHSQEPFSPGPGGAPLP